MVWLIVSNDKNALTYQIFGLRGQKIDGKHPVQMLKRVARMLPTNANIPLNQSISWRFFWKVMHVACVPMSLRQDLPNTRKFMGSINIFDHNGILTHPSYQSSHVCICSVYILPTTILSVDLNNLIYNFFFSVMYIKVHIIRIHKSSSSENYEHSANYCLAFYYSREIYGRSICDEESQYTKLAANKFIFVLVHWFFFLVPPRMGSSCMRVCVDKHME